MTDMSEEKRDHAARAYNIEHDIVEEFAGEKPGAVGRLIEKLREYAYQTRLAALAEARDKTDNLYSTEAYRHNTRRGNGPLPHDHPLRKVGLTKLRNAIRAYGETPPHLKEMSLPDILRVIGESYDSASVSRVLEEVERLG
jgi:hypothetical protein